MTTYPTTCIAFEGTQRIDAGDTARVAVAVKAVYDRSERAPVLVFDDETSRPVEFDLRGSAESVKARVEASMRAPDSAASGEHGADRAESDGGSDAAPRGRGRPKLGVVSREVTLLPRHWDWLNTQPGGASVALRKLVESARLAGGDQERRRLAQESVYRFMTALAGNLANYEDATRALYANDRDRFDALTAAWPVDVREHTLKLAHAAFE